MNGYTIPKATLGRLPIYLQFLRSLPSRENSTISATTIAKGLSLGEVQVRKDLAAVSGAGKPKIGYNRLELIETLENYLGYRERKKAILVGAGKLGEALMGYGGFHDYGLYIVAAFDRNEAMDGLTVHDKPVFAVRRMVDLCRRMHIRIGIITVSPDQAQYVCDQLVSAGVLAIWNFAPVQLRVPDHVIVRNEDLSTSLAMLAHQLQEKLRRQS